MKISKKILPEFFEKILTGEKKFECRIADFKAEPGDILILEEYDPRTRSYTGRKIEKKITFVGKTKDWNFFKQEDIDKYGYMIMSLADN